MNSATKLDPQTTALLALDFQAGIVAMLPSSKAIASAARAADFARKQGFCLIHVGVGFNEGHPEIPETTGLLARVKEGNLFVKGSPSAQFDPSIAKPGELTVYKSRVSAFCENDLHLILRVQRVTDLVLFGLSTSGAVLSTVRRAFDLDYRLTILRDACDDVDAEAHLILMTNIYPKQATVTSVDEFITAQA